MTPAVHADAQADRICRAVVELNAALSTADAEQRLFGVLLSADDLVTAYLTIAELHTQFHFRCEHETLPLRPLAGHA